jgi:hypothetical protein
VVAPVAAVRQLRSLVGLGGLSDSGQLTGYGIGRLSGPQIQLRVPSVDCQLCFEYFQRCQARVAACLGQWIDVAARRLIDGTALDPRGRLARLPAGQPTVHTWQPPRRKQSCPEDSWPAEGRHAASARHPLRHGQRLRAFPPETPAAMPTRARTPRMTGGKPHAVAGSYAQGNGGRVVTAFWPRRRPRRWPRGCLPRLPVHPRQVKTHLSAKSAEWIWTDARRPDADNQQGGAGQRVRGRLAAAP